MSWRTDRVGFQEPGKQADGRKAVGARGTKAEERGVSGEVSVVACRTDGREENLEAGKPARRWSRGPP